MNDTIVQAEREGLRLTTARHEIDPAAAHTLLKSTYWADNMTREQLERAIENSICFAVFRGSEMIAFARVISDLATYAYLTDVIVDAKERGRGLGGWIIEEVLAHPDLQTLRRIALLTGDGERLYERYGFQIGSGKLIYMER